MNTRATRLHMQAQQTSLGTEQGANAILAVGPQALADAFFRHNPPLPHELERAIDAVEDALMHANVPRVLGGHWSRPIRSLAHSWVFNPTPRRRLALTSRCSSSGWRRLRSDVPVTCPACRRGARQRRC